MTIFDADIIRTQKPDMNDVADLIEAHSTRRIQVSSGVNISLMGGLGFTPAIGTTITVVSTDLIISIGTMWISNATLNGVTTMQIEINGAGQADSISTAHRANTSGQDVTLYPNDFTQNLSGLVTIDMAWSTRPGEFGHSGERSLIVYVVKDGGFP